MKRLICITVLLCVLFSIFIVSAMADGEKVSGLFSYEIKGNGTVKIISYDWSHHGNDDLYIPRMLDGYTVTEIGESAFVTETQILLGYP